MNIKQITVTSHPPNTNKVYKNTETHYDKNGNKVEFKEFKKGKIFIWKKFIYDSNNRLIELIKYSGDSYKVEDYKPTSIKYQYDSDGNLLTNENWVEEHNAEGIKTLSSFYLNGTIKCRKFVSPGGSCFEELHYKKESITKTIIYNDTGNIAEVRNFRADGLPLNSTINVYNDKNQLIRITNTSRTGNISEDRVLKYNDNGLIIEDIDHPVNPDDAHADVLDSSGSYNRKYFYDPAGRLESENLYLCGELIMTYKYIHSFW